MPNISLTAASAYSNYRTKAYKHLVLSFRDAGQVVRGGQAIIFVGRLLTSMAHWGSIPFLTLQLVRLGMHASEAILFVGAVTLISRLLAVPIGALGDAFGNGLLLVFDGLIGGPSLVLLGFSGSVGSATVAIVAYSITSAAQAVGYNALIAEVSPNDLQLGAYGMLNTTATIGQVLGPALTAPFLAGREYRIAFVSAAIAHTLAGLLAFRLVGLRTGAARGSAQMGEFEETVSGRHNRTLKLAMLILVTVVYSSIQVTILALGPYAARRFGSAVPASVFFSGQPFLALVLVPLVALSMTGSSIVRQLRMCVVGTALVPVSLMVFGVTAAAGPWIAVSTFIVLFTVSESLASPTVLSILAHTSRSRRAGRTFGAFFMAQSIGITCGSVVTSAISGRVTFAGTYGLFWITVSLILTIPLIIGTVVAAVAARRM